MNKLMTIGLWVALCGVLIVLMANTLVLSWAEDVALEQPQSTVLVFGGGMTDDGQQTLMQFDRVRQAIALYKAGNVAAVIMTGDDGNNRVNEVDAMQVQATNAGVPTSIIQKDGKGYNTRTSCYNAAQLGLTHVTAVSQSFHLPRIVYFCDHYGVKVYPVAADLSNYGWFGSLWVAQIRESLARLKGVWQVEVTHVEPIVI